MLKRWEPAELGEPGGAGDEVEAFLAGEWAEYRATHSEPVPHWAWLNRVAHAPETALRIAVRAPVYGQREFDEWTRLQVCVAEVLVEQAEVRRVTVAELQRSTLIPLELELFSGEGSGQLTDADLLARVIAALRHPTGRAG